MCGRAESRLHELEDDVQSLHRAAEAEAHRVRLFMEHLARASERVGQLDFADALRAAAAAPAGPSLDAVLALWGDPHQQSPTARPV